MATKLEKEPFNLHAQPKPKGITIGLGTRSKEIGAIFPRGDEGRPTSQPSPRINAPAVGGLKLVKKHLEKHLGGGTKKYIGNLQFDDKNVLPDLPDVLVSNKMHSQPFGSEKWPVLGRLMGGKARINSPEMEAVATWYAEKHGVGPAYAAMTGELIKGQINRVFKVDKNGHLNVKALNKLNDSLTPSDVFEDLQRDPNAYKLSPEQRVIFDTVIKPLAQDMHRLAVKYGILEETVDDSGDLSPFFPRIVVGWPKEGEEGKGPSSSFKARAFSSEQQGIDAKYKYEPNLEKRLVTGVHRLYQAIANQRLASNPVLKTISFEQKVAELTGFYSSDPLMTEAKIERMAEGIRTKGQVNQPILVRKIFSPEIAKMLNKEFAAEASTGRRRVVSANSMAKAVTLGFDLGMGQIQLLPLLITNPIVWAEAQVKSIHSMLDPRFSAAYFKAHSKSVRELAHLGSPIGRLQEHMSGAGAGQPLVDLPKRLGKWVGGLPGRAVGSERAELVGGMIGKGIIGSPGYVLEAFGRQFQTGLDVAKIELWEAVRNHYPKSEWPNLVRGIETKILSGRTESAMVPHGRALIERVFLNAPTYYRGAVELVAGMAGSGAGAKEVRKSMGKLLVGAPIIFYLVGKALEMTDDELKEKLDPTSGKFMTWTIKNADGSRSYVGFGGVHRSWIRLIGQVFQTSKEHPENWVSLAPDKNPLTRWYRAHSGPGPSLIWDAFSGKDFLKRDSDVPALGKRLLPLTAQEYLRTEDEPPATALELGASFSGMIALPESFSGRRNRLQNELALSKYQKEFGDLDLLQRRKVEIDVVEQLKGVKTGMSETLTRDYALKHMDERKKLLMEDLGEDLNKWVKDKKVSVGSYSTTKNIGGVSVRLTPEETVTLHSYMVEEFGKHLNDIKNDKRGIKKTDNELQIQVSVRLDIAREAAWYKMNKDIVSKKKAKK